MSIKNSAEQWVRKGPTQAIAVIAAAGLVLGAVLGLGVGYKIEQSRTRSDVERLQKALKAATPAGQVIGPGPLGQRSGQVTSTKPATITISAKKTGRQEINTTSLTRYEKAVKGTTADIVAGRRLLVTDGGSEVIVLAPLTRLGRKVAKVGIDFFTISKPNGTIAARIKMDDVKSVSVLKPATKADIKTGIDILAGGKARTDTVFNAVEVIVLPADSGFVA